MLKRIPWIIVIVLLAVGTVLWSIDHRSTDAISSSEPAPLLSRYDILHATDLNEGVKNALRNNTPEQIDEWLQQAHSVGEAANLSTEDLAFLTSPAARDYVVFHARRSMFNEEFEQRFRTLSPIEPLKQAYPEAQDLFPRVDQLVAQRNQTIADITAEFVRDGLTTEQATQQAQAMWQSNFANQ